MLTNLFKYVTFLFICIPFSAVADYESSLTEDFYLRDQLPQTEVPTNSWNDCCGRWGPRALLYPVVLVPKEFDTTNWLKDRVIAVAKKYIDLPYKHKHIPAAGGLDCSNFTSWVYNYGFGLLIDSNIHSQANTAGRIVLPVEALESGDLIFLWNLDKTRITHVAIFINEYNVIDSTGPGVQIRNFAGNYRRKLAWVRRVYE